jgi:hypothetical protein
VQHGLGDGAAAVERIEDRETVGAAHYGLAIERERLARNRVAVTAIAG